MRRINQRGLVAALESEDEAAAAAAATDDTTTAVVEDPIGENAESLETDLIDVADAEAETGEQEAQVEEAVEVAEALESIADSLRSVAGAGGLSKEAAHTLGLSLEHMYGRVGVSAAVRTMPALESFGGTSSRVQATTLAMEEIQAQAKELWAKILAAIEKSIAWVKEKLELYFGASGKIKARAEGLAKAAAGKSGDAKAAELENGRLFGALHVDGKVDNVVGTAGEIKGSIDALFNTAPERVAALAAFVDSGDEKALGSFFDSLFPSGALSEVSNAEADGFKVAEGFEVYRSHELPGGKAVVAVMPGKSATKVSEDLVNSSISISAFKPNAKAPEGKVKTLAPTEVEKLAKEVAVLADAFQAHKLKLIKGNDEKKKLVAAIKKHGAGADTPEGKKAAKAARSTMSALSKLIDNPVAGGAAYLLNTSKALLDLCEESLKQYAK
ncbi:phiKZ-like phage internal head protein [compost metagenome]